MVQNGKAIGGCGGWGKFMEHIYYHLKYILAWGGSRDRVTFLLLKLILTFLKNRRS